MLFKPLINLAFAFIQESQHEGCVDCTHAAGHAGKWSAKSFKFITDDLMTVMSVNILVTIGVDNDLVYLRYHHIQYILHHGAAIQFNQALVLSAHTLRLTSGQYYTCENSS